MKTCFLKGMLVTAIALIVLSAAASASAQVASNMIQVTVPFSFIAAGRSYPAGDYTVKINRQNDLVMLTSWPNSAMVLTRRDLRPAERDLAYLRFRQFGERWVLQEIMLYGTGQQLSPGGLEKEFAKSNSADKKIFAAKVDN